MNLITIDPKDKELIEQLRVAIADELKLVPAYDDDVSLLRWLIGWDRKIGQYFLGYLRNHKMFGAPFEEV